MEKEQLLELYEALTIEKSRCMTMVTRMDALLEFVQELLKETTKESEV